MRRVRRRHAQRFGPRRVTVATLSRMAHFDPCGSLLQLAPMGRNHRARWSAIGAAVAVSIGAGGLITFASAAGGSSSTFTVITPCRLLDTRSDGPPTGATPARTAPLGQGQSLTITARGNFGR